MIVKKGDNVIPVLGRLVGDNQVGYHCTIIENSEPTTSCWFVWVLL